MSAAPGHRLGLPGWAVGAWRDQMQHTTCPLPSEPNPTANRTPPASLHQLTQPLVRRVSSVWQPPASVDSLAKALLSEEPDEPQGPKRCANCAAEGLQRWPPRCSHAHTVVLFAPPSSGATRTSGISSAASSAPPASPPSTPTTRRGAAGARCVCKPPQQHVHAGPHLRVSLQLVTPAICCLSQGCRRWFHAACMPATASSSNSSSGATAPATEGDEAAAEDSPDAAGSSVSGSRQGRRRRNLFFHDNDCQEVCGARVLCGVHHPMTVWCALRWWWNCSYGVLCSKTMSHRSHRSHVEPATASQSDIMCQRAHCQGGRCSMLRLGWQVHTPHPMSHLTTACLHRCMTGWRLLQQAGSRPSPCQTHAPSGSSGLALRRPTRTTAGDCWSCQRCGACQCRGADRLHRGLWWRASLSPAGGVSVCSVTHLSTPHHTNCLQVRQLYKDAQKRETLFKQHRKAQRQLEAAAKTAADREEAAKRSRGFGFGGRSASSNSNSGAAAAGGQEGSASEDAAAGSSSGSKQSARASSLDEFMLVSEVLKPLGETPRYLLDDSYAIITRDGRCAVTRRTGCWFVCVLFWDTACAVRYKAGMGAVLRPAWLLL